MKHFKRKDRMLKRSIRSDQLLQQDSLAKDGHHPHYAVEAVCSP